MKKWIVRVLFVGIVGFGIGAGSLEEVSGQVTTEGKLELTDNHSPTPPKNPMNPAEPEDTSDSNNPPTNEKSPLSLDVVPKGFYFGKQKMYHETHEYKANGVADHRQYLQVTDNRDNGIYGWTLMVRQDGYLKDEQSGYELKGSIVTLPRGEARNRNNHEGATEVSSDLTTYAVEVTNEEKILFSASGDSSKKAGKSTSTNSWRSQEVTLTIPKNTVKEGVYKNKIYWILTDGGPTN